MLLNTGSGCTVFHHVSISLWQIREIFHEIPKFIYWQIIVRVKTANYQTEPRKRTAPGMWGNYILPNFDKNMGPHFCSNVGAETIHIFKKKRGGGGGGGGGQNGGACVITFLILIKVWCRICFRKYMCIYYNFSAWRRYIVVDQGPLLLTWFNFNPSMDK